MRMRRRIISCFIHSVIHFSSVIRWFIMGRVLMMIMLIISRIWNLLSFEIPMTHPKDQDSLFSYVFSITAAPSVLVPCNKTSAKWPYLSKSCRELSWNGSPPSKAAALAKERCDTQHPHRTISRRRQLLFLKKIKSLWPLKDFGGNAPCNNPKKHESRPSRLYNMSQRVNPLHLESRLVAWPKPGCFFQGTGKAATNSSSLIPPTWCGWIWQKKNASRPENWITHLAK